MNPTNYTIPAPLVQAIVSTMAALPWRDVHQIMGALMPEIQRQEAPPPADPPAPPPEK